VDYIGQKKQAYIDSRKRKVLVDWVFEVVEQFDMSEELFFLSIFYFDRYFLCT
jgi:hypothetical protein